MEEELLEGLMVSVLLLRRRPSSVGRDHFRYQLVYDEHNDQSGLQDPRRIIYVDGHEYNLSQP